MGKAFRKYIISGLLIWIPILVTVVVVRFIVNIMEGSIALLPARYQPDALIGYHIPGVGVILTVLIVLLTGIFGANFFGNRVVALWDKLINRIPLVRSVYMGVKQVMNTLFISNGRAFRNVMLVEYPRRGMWSLAFETGDGCQEMNKKLNEDDLVTLFIMTTPNPTSGFLMVVPRSDTKQLDMSVDQAFKFWVSLGVVKPENQAKEKQIDVQEGMEE